MNASITVFATFTLDSGPPDPSQGTIGTQFNIFQPGLGTKKGKVLVGGLTTKIVSWTDSSITCEIKKPLPTGVAYDVVVQPKGPKGTSPIVYEDAFTMMTAEITSVLPNSGVKEIPITLSGNYFGSKKGKLYLGNNKCKVLSWTMDAATGSSRIQFVVPKKLTSDTYDITLTNKVGSGTLVDGFTLR
jgi:hypothetical protein